VAGVGASAWVLIVLVALMLLVAGTVLLRGEMWVADVVGGAVLLVLAAAFMAGRVVVDGEGVGESGIFGTRRVLWSKTDYACPASDLSAVDLNFYDSAGNLAGRMNFALYAAPEKIVEEIARRTRLEREPAAIAPGMSGRWREGEPVSAVRMFSLMWEIIHAEPRARAVAIEKVYRLMKDGRLGGGTERESLLEILQSIAKDGITDASRRALEDWYWRSSSDALRSHLSGYLKGAVIGVTIPGAAAVVKTLLDPARAGGKGHALLWVVCVLGALYLVMSASAMVYVRVRFQREMAFLKEYKSEISGAEKPGKKQ
jgi:hypothetical protein